MAISTFSTGHVRKRQYQPSIKSYFNRDADNSGSFRPERPTSPLSPRLPEETQASLLSVGMRVRKSVPEGYKTHKTLATTYEYTISSTAPATLPAPVQRYGYAKNNTRELMPFCGLHKIGGLASQDIPSSSAPAIMLDDRNDDLPGLTFSQSTLYSTQESSGSVGSAMSGWSRKRTYEEKIEDDLDAYFDVAELDEAVDTTVCPPERPIAPMKSSRKITTDRSMRVFGSDDFEEAAFLVPPEGMDLDDD